jgi:hypothetical protein
MPDHPLLQLPILTLLWQEEENFIMLPLKTFLENKSSVNTNISISARTGKFQRYVPLNVILTRRNLITLFSS